jgi:hypothetical protein
VGKLVPSLFLVVLLASPARSADWVPGTYMLQALGQMMRSVLEVSEKTDYGYDDGICIMAAFLRPKGTIGFLRQVVKGQSYVIAGGGDNDVGDLDLEIYDEFGRKIASDTGDDNHPVVLFTSSYSGRITIRLNLFSAARASFCVVSVLRRGGWNVPRANVERSAVGIIGAAISVDRQVKGDVVFQAGPNQWALYGGMFRPGDQIEITNVGLGTGRRVVLAAGDTQAEDIDLFVEVGGKQAKDDDPDPTPLVDITVTNVSSATLRIHNVKSGGPSLILTTILQVE